MTFGTKLNESGVLGPAPGADDKKQGSDGESLAFGKASRAFGSLATLNELDEANQGRSSRRNAGEERSGRGAKVGGKSEEDER